MQGLKLGRCPTNRAKMQKLEKAAVKEPSSSGVSSEENNPRTTTVKLLVEIERKINSKNEILL